ncbi:glycoside hydrolase family 36 protein [Novisyntrophococcus fermenticellae]|uniref:glycoside hydrolase family 36 protein n=1 Tax=Novisyntrophococcus fermenticellae TaxID=2068655 RepID=UPI001E4556EB|nr:glycoside hydrolase family 36 protein [Novisyntrophococcus fermenticellae]
MKIEFIENNIHIHISETEDGTVVLEQLSPMEETKDIPLCEKNWYPLVEIKLSNCNQINHRGSKHVGSCPGDKLKYDSHKIYRNNYGKKIEVIQRYKDMYVESHMQFFDGVSVVRAWTVIKNNSGTALPLEFVSSFALTGIKSGEKTKRDKNAYVYLPHNTWYGEAQWKKYTLNELGYDAVGVFSMKKIEASASGTWPSHEYLPMGCFEDSDANVSYLWQIETSCSWHWEISDCMNELYLQLYGPVYDKNNFFKNIQSGESFISEPAAVAIVSGGFEQGIKELTKYRRIIRRKNNDNIEMPVIFNDYMNCLFGDPTSEKLFPLIDKAAECGCEYFCIDAGWYDKGPWWDGIGEWIPSKERFPNGIEEPLNYIKQKGMIPGLWLEIESVGVNCPIVKKVPKDWFFQRNGIVVTERSRYQLDFRNPEVRAYASGIIKRLVESYGIGYIKMDYNVNFGVGTTIDADSPGDGLLEHTRCYLKWLEEVFERYPQLVIENCGSGGMRMSYSLLQRHSIQSVTDQTDYIRMAAIAANAASALTPEQAAIWSYPLKDGDCEETVFNMVNAMLLRIHQSGHIAELSENRFDLITEGIACYKKIRKDIAAGFPIFPLGLADMSKDFLCFGIDTEHAVYLAVWRIQGEEDTVAIEIEEGRKAELIYPLNLHSEYTFQNTKKTLTVKLEPKTARLFKVLK